MRASTTAPTMTRPRQYACSTRPHSSSAGSWRCSTQYGANTSMPAAPMRICSAWPQASGRRPRRALSVRLFLSSWKPRAFCCCRRRSRVCQACLRSSSSMVVSISFTEFVADARLQAADLGRHIGFAEAEDLADLALAALVEVEQHERAVERVEAFDAGV